MRPTAEVLEYALATVDFSSAVMHTPMNDKLPVEPPPQPESDHGTVRKLRRALCGFRCSSVALQKLLVRLLAEAGPRRGALSASTHPHSSDGARMTVQIDDPLVIGPREAVIALTELLGMHIAAKVLEEMTTGTDARGLGRFCCLTPGGSVERTPSSCIDVTAVLIEVQDGRPPVPPYRPYAAKELSRWFQAPREIDHIAAARLVKFSTHPRGAGVIITPEQGRDWKVSRSSDSDRVGCGAPRRSTSGAPVRLNGVAVSAVRRYQTVLAMSSPEAELYARRVAPTVAKYVQAWLSDRGAEAAAVSHFTDSPSAVVRANRFGLGGLGHMELKLLLAKREVEVRRVRVKEVAGLDITTCVATKHVVAATFSRCQTALGLTVFAGELRGANAAGEETEGGSSALLVAMTCLAVAGAHALLERCGRVARRLCGREPRAEAVTAWRDAASQTEPTAAAPRAATESAALPALYVDRYGWCVHESGTCRGLSLVRHAVRELRPCAVCMPRRG
jgi:hypothetical protein